MRFKRIFVLFLSVAALTVAAKAQAVPVTAAPTKIAIVETDAFSDPKVGVKKLVNALQTLDTEFKQRRDEITALKARYDTLVREINSPPPGTTQQVLAQKADQAQTLETDIKRKQEDGANAYSRRAAALTDPINLQINNALQAFAKARGVDVLIDMSKLRGSMLILNNAVNITQAFIADYNAKNP